MPLNIEAEGVKIPQLDRIVNVLRAITALVEGLLKAIPSARRGVVVAKRIEDEPEWKTYGLKCTIRRYRRYRLRIT